MTPLPSWRNPFISNSSSSPVPESQPAASIEPNGSQPPSLPESQASVPAITLSPPPRSNTTQPGPPPQPGFDSTDLDEPPPYTPSASATSGETTIEVGPTRPFQRAQPSANPSRHGLSPVHNQITDTRVPSPSSLPLPASSPRTPPVSILQQLTNSVTHVVNDVVNNLNTPPISSSNSSNYHWRAPSVQPTGQSNTWTSYPGQNTRSALPPLSHPTPRNARPVPPPRHPLSTSSSLHSPPLTTSSHSLPSMPNPSSDFARDLYAVGTGSGGALVTENIFAPPAGPPPSVRQASTTTHSAFPSDGRPTSRPAAGHPLLKDEELLVYPVGYECGKCHNVGYKDGDPLKPCKSCWKKYAKPFQGPLAYSFSTNTSSSSRASNFQKPLPYVPPRAPPPIPTAFSSSPPTTRFASGGYMTNHHGGFHSQPSGPIPLSSSVTYTAGDPRIGGTLCWKCGGQGSVDVILFLRETCALCLGVGRLFR